MSDCTSDLTITVKVVHGEPMIDVTAMSLLFGVDEKLIAAQRRRSFNGSTTSFPDEWFRNGRRRAKEAASRTGRNDMVSSLEYWAHKDRGAQLNIIYEGGEPA